MKTILSKFSLLLVLGSVLTSCYYTSPVPLAQEGKLLDKSLQGTWEMLGETAEESFTVNFYDQPDNEGYNGDLILVGYDDKKQLKKEFHKLKIFITTVNGLMIANIGIDVYEPDGEYFFAKYTWDPGKLTLFYVNESPFKNATGQIEKYKSEKRLKKRFSELMNHKDFFETEKPLIFYRVD